VCRTRGRASGAVAGPGAGSSVAPLLDPHLVDPVALLVLDPHYAGPHLMEPAARLPWCGWCSAGERFSRQSFFNLCLPLRSRRGGPSGEQGPPAAAGDDGTRPRSAGAAAGCGGGTEGTEAGAASLSTEGTAEAGAGGTITGDCDGLFEIELVASGCERDEEE